MAFMNQDRKKELAPRIKEICKEYGVKATLSVRHHSELVLNIKSSGIDFIGNYNSVERYTSWGEPRRKAEYYLGVNEYYIHEDFTGEALEFLTKINEAMNDGNFDNSDPMTDYFHVGWYTQINIGSWEKHYELKRVA